MIPKEEFKKGAQDLESLALAYQEALKTYDWSLQRFDTWDGNLDKILAWGSPLSIGMLGAVLAKDIPALSHLFFIVLSAALIIAAIACAFCGKQTGEIDLIDPAKRIAAWLALDPEAFRWYAVRDAGLAQEKNDKSVRAKASLSTAAVILFALSALASALTWIFQINPCR